MVFLLALLCADILSLSCLCQNVEVAVKNYTLTIIHMRTYVHTLIIIRYICCKFRVFLRFVQAKNTIVSLKSITFVERN